MAKHKITVGQVVLIEMRDVRNRAQVAVVEECTVTKVGRDWAYYGHGARFSLENLTIDGVFGRGRSVHLSREAYEEKVERDRAWSELRKFFEHKWSPPGNLSADAIRSVLSTLKGEG